MFDLTKKQELPPVRMKGQICSRLCCEEKLLFVCSDALCLCQLANNSICKIKSIKKMSTKNKPSTALLKRQLTNKEESKKVI